MSGDLGGVVAHLLAAIETLDAVAIGSLRAKDEATQAGARYSEARTGTSATEMNAALHESQIAADKAGKVARLVAQASEHLTEYLNVIAPGTARPRQAAPSAVPTGEQILVESEASSGKENEFLRRFVKKADDAEEAFKKHDQAVTSGLKQIYKGLRGGPGEGGSTSSTTQPAPAPPDRPQVDQPIAAVIMATAAAAVGVKGLWNAARKHRERSRSDDQPEHGQLHQDDGEGRS